MASFRLRLLLVLFAAAVLLPAQTADEERFRRLRDEMVRGLGSPRYGAEPIRNERVLQAFRDVPRHRFVPPDLVRYAYYDSALPLPHDQSISQPYVVAKMTEAVEPEKHHRVLEVGTGSGYQAAILSRLVAEVYTIEILEPLATTARARLQELGYNNVEVRLGDGYLGWPDKAPFDSIVVTAGATEVPPALVEQLKPGGRMIIPVGDSPTTQKLVLLTKDANGKVRRREVLDVTFVPLVRGKQ